MDYLILQTVYVFDPGPPRRALGTITFARSWCYQASAYGPDGLVNIGEFGSRQRAIAAMRAFYKEQQCNSI